MAFYFLFILSLTNVRVSHYLAFWAFHIGIELNVVRVYDVNHYLAFITRYIMPVGYSHLLYGNAHRVICFAYPRILL